MSEVQKALVKMCIPFSDGEPGFATPLFSSSFSQNLIQEVDEVTNLISRFRPLVDGGNGILLTSKVEAKLGGHPVYAFIDERGEATVGTLDVLSSTLRSFLIRCPDRIAICVQIVELIGSEEEQRDAKIRMRQTILRESGSAAASAFYEKSALRSSLWKNLVKIINSEDLVRRILSIRAKIDAAISPTGEVTVDLTALEEHEKAQIDVEKLIDLLGREFDFHGFELPLEPAPIAETQTNDTAEAEQRVRSALLEIKNSGRQERRLAIIYDLLLDDPKAGMLLLDSYRQDSALFATRTLNNLRASLDSSPLITWEMIVLSSIYRALTDYYGLLKGEILLEFAKRLGQHREVHSLIASRARNSRSYYVQFHRQEIEHALSKHLRKQQVGPEGLPLFQRED